jgi:hypothetical protein
MIRVLFEIVVAGLTGAGAVGYAVTRWLDARFRRRR